MGGVGADLGLGAGGHRNTALGLGLGLDWGAVTGGDSVGVDDLTSVCGGTPLRGLGSVWDSDEGAVGCNKDSILGGSDFGRVCAVGVFGGGSPVPSTGVATVSPC